MRTPKILLGLAFAGLLTIGGCNATQDAQRAEAVIASIVGIAQAEESALPAADAAILTQWANLGATLDGQLKTCITSASAGGGKKAAFLACFNTFSQGLLGSSELAQLRIVSPTNQAKVQLIVTAVSTGLNVAIAAMGGAPTPTPQVAAAQPTSAELAQLARQVGVSPSYGF